MRPRAENRFRCGRSPRRADARSARSSVLCVRSNRSSCSAEWPALAWPLGTTRVKLSLVLTHRRIVGKIPRMLGRTQKIGISAAVLGAMITLAGVSGFDARLIETLNVGCARIDVAGESVEKRLGHIEGLIAGLLLGGGGSVVLVRRRKGRADE